MTASLSLTMTSPPTATTGLAGSLAGDGTGAATGFDALLSAQLFATAPENPLNSKLHGLSPTLAPIAPLPPVVASASPAVAGTPPSLPATAAPAPALVAPVMAPATPAPSLAMPVPAEAPATDAPAAPTVAVAGNLPETGNALPAKLPRSAATLAEPDSEADSAAADETSVPKAKSGDEPVDLPPAAPSPVDVVLSPLTIFAAAPVIATAQPAAPAPAASSARGSVSAKANGRVAVDTSSREQPRPEVPASPAHAAPQIQPAAPVRSDNVAASPEATPPAPMVSGIAVAIAAAQPTLVPTAFLSAVAEAMPTSARTETPASDPQYPAKFANPRDYALSISQPANVASAVAATEGKSAAPGGQGEVGHGQPPMADPSLTSPAGPSPVVSPEATRGPATPFAQQITPMTAPPPQLAVVTPAVHDMSSLVDRLVEARAAARSAASPMTVTTAVRHAEFGSVSLRFDTAGDGLSVTMASNDPGFAPAAQAALASQVLASTSPAADASTQQNPQRQHAPEQGSSAFQSGNAMTGGFTQNQQQQPQGQQSQPTFAATTRQPARPETTSAGSEPSADPSSNRSGVFA